MRRPLLALGIASAIAACVPTFDDDLALVRAPRLVAVRAVPAEAPPGTDVVLEALVVGPDGSSVAQADVTWGLCLARKPLTELGPVAQACVEDLGRGGASVTPLAPGPSTRASLPGEACRLFGPLQPAADASGVSGRAVDPDVTGGYHQPVVLRAAGSVTLASVRLACGAAGLPNAENVRFGLGYRPNENPALERIELLADGSPPQAVVPGAPLAPLTARAGARVTLRAVWPACPREPACGDGLCTAGENATTCPSDCAEAPRGCAGAETYLHANQDTRVVETRREGMAAAWFTTAGELDAEQTGRAEEDDDGVDATNVWTAPRAPGDALLWVVLRDDRGGVAFQELRVTVTP